jgi:hypothetical protein
MVRTIACTIRGDASVEVLPLKAMPSISIDLPKTKHGYNVQAEEVFWVNQGVLLSTDLRDSMDEQCIADIAASIIGGSIVDRSKDYLNNLYSPGHEESNKILNAIDAYGSEKFSEEFKYCIDEILKVCTEGTPEKLRNIIFEKNTTNAFPSIFAILLIAFHELIIKEAKKISNYRAIRRAIKNLDKRLVTGRKATSPDERRKSVDTVKGLIGSSFVKADISPQIYGGHATTDIEVAIRRSEIELPDYELKQGLLSLDGARYIDKGVIDKVLKTICAIANNGRGKVGKVLIGVTDKDTDSDRIKELDKVVPKKVGKRFVVGVAREAKILNIPTEQYFSKWRNAIKGSELSQPLKDDILSNIDYNDFYGLGIIIVTIPSQSDLSYIGEEVYWRDGNSTEHAVGAKKIAALTKRF